MTRWEWQYAPYRLRVRAPIGAKMHSQQLERSGALVRIRPDSEQNSGRSIWGYTDFFFWPELGDPSLDEVIRDLSAKREVPLILKGRFLLAREDWIARAQGLSAFVGETGIRNHFLLPTLLGESLDSICLRLENATHAGFREVKVKVGRDPVREAQVLTSLMGVFRDRYLWRLDANESFQNPADFLAFWAQLPADLVSTQVEWVEDPTVFSFEYWSEIRARAQVELAADFSLGASAEALQIHPGHAPFGVRILKPARDDLSPYLHPRDYEPGGEGAIVGIKQREGLPRLCLTSYLGHPLEQMASLALAARLKQLYPDRVTSCGLASHGMYELNAYSSGLSVGGGELFPAAGTGWGWDALLASEVWLPGGVFESLAVR